MTQQRHRQITIAIALCLTLAACGSITTRTTYGAAAPGSPPSGGPLRPWPASATCPTPARSAADAPRLVALLNAERARAGLGPLTLAPALSVVAQAHACDLAARGDIGHSGSDGSTLTERLARGGIAAAMVAENTASGQSSAEAVLAGWLASPGHRANILRPNAARVGLGQADGAQAVWVMAVTS